MRIPHLLLVITLGLVICGCNADPPGAGTEGHVCRSWPKFPCDEGLNCKNNVCTPCSGPGEDCCTVAGGTAYCDTSAGLACDGEWAEQGVCQDDCGLIGLPCCENGFTGGDCPGTGTCNLDTGMCVGEATDPCFGGAYEFPVYVVNQYCEYSLVVLKADTAEQAESCRLKILVDGALPGNEVCKLGQLPTESQVCQTDGEGKTYDLYLPHCSPEQLPICEYYQCTTCSWSDGACPAD